MNKFVLLALCLATCRAQAAWYDNPSVKATIDTGYVKTYASGINLSEDGAYLMANLGSADDAKPVQLYRTADLIAQWGETKGIKYGEVFGTNLFGTGGNGWKGGAISATLGLMIPGSGKADGALYTSLAIPNYAWTTNATAFRLSGLADRGSDAMDFNATGTRLYANRHGVAELTVYDTSTLKTTHALTCLKTVTAVGASRIRGLDCYTVGGGDLVYYGEGAGGRSVFVYDPSDDSVTTLSVPAADGDIAAVKLSGTATGNPLMYVLVESGTLLVYSLDATGKALASATPVKTFDAAALKALSGMAGVSGAALAYSSFEVTDDGRVALLAAHDTNAATQDTTVGRLAVLATLNGGQMSTASTGVVTFSGTAADPYVLTSDKTASGDPAELVYNGYKGGEGALVVQGAKLSIAIGDAKKEIRFGSSDSSRTVTKSTTVINNGSVSAKHLIFSGYGTSDGSTKNTELNTVYLNEGGSLVGQMIVYDDPRTHFVFNGGYFNSISKGGDHDRKYSGLSAIFRVGGNSQNIYEATAGNYIDLLNDQDLSLTARGSNTGSTYLTGAGGFRKRGTGKLKIGDPGCLTMDYAGDTVLAAGTVQLYGDNLFPFGAGKGKVVLSGATLDMYGKTLTANAVVCGAGTIGNTASAAATLVVGADGSDSVFAANLPDNVTLVKRGAGTLALRTKGPANVRIEEGAIRLADAAYYSHYRFKVTKTYGSAAQCLNISEFRLLDSATDVTRPYVKVSRSGTGTDGEGFVWKPGQSGESIETPAMAVDGNLATKFTDHNGACDASDELKEQCWLQLDYGGPIRVTAYNWATAKDCYYANEFCRNPQNWQLLGSNDGTTWTVLDSQAGYAWIGAQYSWTPNDFTLSTGSLESSDVIVSPGARLESTNGSEIRVGGGAIAGDVGADATLVKTGDDILHLRAQAPGTVEVAGGTLAVGAATFAHYRFKVTRAYGAECDCMIISEFKLLDSGTDVTRVEGNEPTASRSGTGKDGAGWSWKGVSEGPECAIDGDFGTKFTDHNGANKIDSTYGDMRDACWLQLDYATPVRVTAYQWATGADKYLISDSGCRNPKNWQLLGSEDGTNNWIVLDERTDYAWAGAQKSWTPDAFDATAGSVADSTLTVGAGATLDLTGCATPVSSLQIDVAALAEGVGTIRGGTFAASGTIALVNAAGTKLGHGLDLRLAFADSSVTTETFSNWTVTVDGVAIAQRVTVVDGVLTLTRRGLSILVR